VTQGTIWNSLWGARGEIEALDVSPGYYDVSLENAGNFALKSMFALHAKWQASRSQSTALKTFSFG
jgi:hypothetical protein